jgi:hypothetical protein
LEIFYITSDQKKRNIIIDKNIILENSTIDAEMENNYINYIILNFVKYELRKELNGEEEIKIIEFEEDNNYAKNILKKMDIVKNYKKIKLVKY